MRLFIAINFNEDVIEDLVRLQAEFKRCRVAGNFTKPENLHLTLVFIGEYGNPDDILDVMETVPFHPVPLKFDGLQHFRDMYFAGIGHTPELESYVRRLRRALSGNGIPFDRKKFSPHVTLIRKVSFRDGAPGSSKEYPCKGNRGNGGITDAFGARQKRDDLHRNRRYSW